MSSVNADEEQTWLPTHVQVTVLRGRGLRGKGKNGTSDVYTIIQVGKEKYSTCVVEKTTSPEWKEECSFELLPGVLEDGGRSAYPPGSCDLILTVMHRALIGLDVFLGQAVIPLDKAFQDNICTKNEAEWMNLRSRWFRLNSKTGKKEKERGEIQATVQFTRNNLTASMYHLAMKEKSHSAFSKLKERMRGKRRSVEEDSSSAILPTAGHSSLRRARSRLPSDGGGEEEYEDDEGGEGRRNKMRTFFLRGKLRKSPETRSSTSLGSESSESSRGGSLSPTAGISVVVSDLSNSPSNSSNLTADNSPEHTADASPKLSPDRSEFGDECGEISIMVPSLLLNGSSAHHVPPLQPGSGNPAASLRPLHKPLPVSVSLQNLSPRAPEHPGGPAADGRRWSFDKPGEKEKAAITEALEQSGPMLGEENQPGPTGTTPAATGAATESRGKKKNALSQGGSGSGGRGRSRSGDEPEQGPGAAPHRGWLGSDPHNKASLVASPMLGPSTGSRSHPPLLLPDPQVPRAPPRHPPPPLGSPLNHTNPFCHVETPPPPMSPRNPFFYLQRNPFYGETLTDRALTPPSSSLPPLPYLSSSRPPVAQLFPRARYPGPFCGRPASEDDMDTPTSPSEEALARLKRRPLPPPPAAQERPVCKRSPNPFICSDTVQLDVEWDESFEAFAACRLQSSENVVTGCEPLQNMPKGPLPLKHWGNVKRGATSPTNSDSSLDTITESSPESFSQLFDSIPAHNKHEDDSTPLNTCANPPEHGGCTATNLANYCANTNGLTGCNTSQEHNCQYTHSPTSLCRQGAGDREAQGLKDYGDSSNPSSSGVGSLAEEDALSSISSHSASERFSAISADETNQVNMCDKSSEQTVVKRVKDSEAKVIDWSTIDHIVEGNLFQLSDEKSVISKGKDPFLVPLSTISPVELESGDQPSELPTPPYAAWSDLPSDTSDTSVISDPLPNPTVSMRHNESQKEKAGCELQESSWNLHDPENISVLATNCNAEVISADILDTSSSSGITTTLSREASFFLETRISPGSEDKWLACQSSPKISGHLRLDTSQTLSTDIRVLDDCMLCEKWSNPSSGSPLNSLYVSTDSQHYQSCLSYQSSQSPTDSVEALGQQPTKTLCTSTPTLCGFSGINEIHSPKNVSTLGLDVRPDAGRPADNGITQIEAEEELFQSEDISPSENFATHLEPCFRKADFGFISDTLTDSCINCKHHDDKLSGGALEGQCLQSDDPFPARPQSECLTLQRSHSEGTLGNGFSELSLASYGSDPSVIQAPDTLNVLSVHPYSTRLLHLSPASCLPAERSAPLACCCSLPPTVASVVHSVPPALRTAKLPASDGRHATDAPHPEVWQQKALAHQQNSPHPVRPLMCTSPVEQRRMEGRSVLEKLKSTIHPGWGSQPSEAQPERKKSLTEGAGSYYHLTHSELVALLVQREAELGRQRAEFERQTVLLSKREVELLKLKPQVRDLENYIDTLLVRIMEQTPTLLQVRSKFK